MLLLFMSCSFAQQPIPEGGNEGHSEYQPVRWTLKLNRVPSGVLNLSILNSTFYPLMPVMFIKRSYKRKQICS